MRRITFPIGGFGSLLALVVLAETGRSADSVIYNETVGIRQTRKLLPEFDKDNDKRLNPAELKAARDFLRTQRNETAPLGPQLYHEPPKTGPKVSPADAESFPKMPLYELKTLRTFFLDFDSADWEQQLTDFRQTDVEVTARLTVDGASYSEVGVHFRGSAEKSKIEPGRKRSLGLSIDYVNEEQQLADYRTLNLLNAYGDPTFLRMVLYHQIAREHIPAPKANFARLVMNGESWGVYVNAQQFNKDFLRDWFRTSKGTRWKVLAGGSLSYLGKEKSKYQVIYDMKSKEDPKAWADLITLCNVLNETPPAALEKALDPILDIDGTLKFLALENVLLNCDGQWSRSANYSLYKDERGRFHFIPGDADASMRAPKDGEYSSASKLDPLAGVGDPKKPLLSKLLAVPSFRERYLAYVGNIAERSLDGDKLELFVRAYVTLISEDVKADTRKLYSFEDFTNGVAQLQELLKQRRAFLLNNPDVKAARLNLEASLTH